MFEFNEASFLVDAHSVVQCARLISIVTSSNNVSTPFDELIFATESGSYFVFGIDNWKIVNFFSHSYEKQCFLIFISFLSNEQGGNVANVAYNERELCFNESLYMTRTLPLISRIKRENQIIRNALALMLLLRPSMSHWSKTTCSVATLL